MKRAIWMLAAAVTAFPATLAGASVVVIGNNPGHACYQAARAQSGSRGALQSCKAALEAGLLGFHDKVGTHVNRGIVKLHGRDYEGAITDFDRAISLDPKEAESYLNKGSTYLRKGEDPLAAAALFTEALKRKTDRPELAYYGRAIAHEVAGDAKSAYLDYRRATQADPEWPQPRRELARFIVRQR